MATYKEIQDWIKNKYGYTVKTCWIAHAKEICGLTLRHAPNRQSKTNRVIPCLRDEIEPIKQAFRHYEMI